METTPRHAVELQPAFAFHCEECGAEGFVRAIVPELSKEDEQAIREEHGMEPWEAGCVTMLPATVKCKECGTEFDTKCYGDD